MTLGIKSIFVLLAAALALGAGVGPAGAAELKPWRHGTLDAKSDAGILFMINQGFAEKQGLKLQIAQFHNDIVEIQALLAGDLDSYESSPGSAILAASRGADVKIIGCPWPVLPHALFVAKGIKSVEDLKGKTIAVSAPGSLPDIFARAVLNQHHIAPSEVHFANLGNDPDRFKSVVAGIAQATVVSRQFEPVAEKQGVKLLVSAQEAMPNDVRLCTMVTGKTLATRREDAVHYVAAEIEALRYAVSHRAEALKLTDELTHEKPDDPRAAYIYDWAVSSHAVDPEMSIPVDKLEYMEKELVTLGNIKKPFDVKTMFDGSVRKAALALVGKK
ncbi:MAG TPA: ABC transporter substrate-binding protein [Stellaceae bacterium]|nr:ABC transporter substrate-binding protein [Stellaceae bacterium]